MFYRSTYFARAAAECTRREKKKYVIWDTALCALSLYLPVNGERVEFVGGNFNFQPLSF